MVDARKYWPGGIPAHVRAHPEPLIEVDDQENATTQPPNSQEDPDLFIVAQRRNLVSRWASMTQQERDSYHSRAPPTSSRDRILRVHAGGSNWFPEILADKWPCVRPAARAFCIALLPRESPSDDEPIGTDYWGLWTKIRIMLYNLDGFDDGPVFYHNQIGVATPSPAATAAAAASPENNEPAVVTPDEFFMWAHVESADFARMAMTRQGTVIFHRHGQYMFVDQTTLNEGAVLLCDIENNGRVMFKTRMLPVKAQWLRGMVFGLGKPIREIAEHRTEFETEPLNMREPIIRILEHLSEPDGSFQGAEPEWTEDINRYAPGYLDMERAATVMVDEARGTVEALVRDYDHSLFTGG